MKLQEKILRNAGLRVTVPRIYVLEVLQENRSECTHISAEEIYREILSSGKKISQGAIYRVLSQFEKVGLVNRRYFDLNRSHAVYELSEERKQSHNHMVCVNTGNIMEFSDAVIESREKEIIEQQGYEIISREVVIYVRKREEEKLVALQE
ncbi:MAG: transcriptional repressor [Pseudomonadales bacterium]|nr:transcriptional repressor [Pseudomonadales bacterium]